MRFEQDVLDHLKENGYAVIDVEQWDAKFRLELCHWLDQHEFKDYQFHRLANDKNKYVIVLPNTVTPFKLEQTYRVSRGFILKILPLVISFALIAITVWVASYSESLMVAVIVMVIPVVLGMLLEYFSSLETPTPLKRMMFKNPLLILAAVLVFGALVLREGVICLVILSPLILVFSMIGIAITRFISQFLWKPSDKLYSIAILPMILLLVLPELNHAEYSQTKRSVIIHAPQEQVFYAINHIGKIQAEEVPYSPIFTIGFPKPTFGMTQQQGEHLVRTIEWERGVKFQELVTTNQAPNKLGWVYQFDENSFPKGSMDDHVKIGGKYFNLLQTDYELTKIDEDTTELTLTIDYRVSTEYNWYSKLWVNYVLNEFSDVVMEIHKNRLEKI